MSQAIESESSLILGFRTLGMTSLRSLVESDFKFLYYENHPIEYCLHKKGKFDLPISEYRNFLYIYPNSETIEDLKREYIESIWTELCGYVHSSLKSITPMTFVEDIDTIFSLSEPKWQKTIKLIKKVIRMSVIISFIVNNDWGKPIEKAYFDEIFKLFTAQESNKIKTAFNIT
ncbi:MAG: hypothetical protein KAR64_05045 [Thermoplasmatales archaeon]|nr:hypothetical protein [Thermoplasmatales archaeon]